MLIEYFKLQLKLLNRKLVDFGISKELGYPLIFIGFYLVSNYLVEKLENYCLLYAILPISLALKLSQTERNTFLKQTYSKGNFYLIRAFENFFIALPFALFLFVKEYYWLSMSTLFSTIVLALFNLKSNGTWVLPTPFSKKPFEFMLGFRKSFPLLIITLFLAFIAIKVKNLNLAIGSICIIQLLSCTFYFKPENPYFVWIHNNNPKTFLIKKIKDGIKNMFSLTLPNLVITSVFFYRNLDEIGLFYAIGVLFFIIVILMKYASFPNQIGIPQLILLGVSLYFPPLLLLFIPYFYKEAIQKLKNYLE